MANDLGVPSPPSDVTGALRGYLDTMTAILRGLVAAPKISAFSSQDPNGEVSGYPGDIAVNITSATTDLRIYQKGGGIRVPSTTGWNLL